MIKVSDNSSPRGWSALKLLMEEEGFCEKEIEDAEVSFREGVEVLSKLFFCNYKEKHKNGH